MSLRFLFGASLLLLLVSACGGRAAATDSSHDGASEVSGAVSVRLERLDALGFCVGENQFTDVTITKNAAGERELVGTVFVRDSTGEPSCSSTCYVTREAGPLVLSDTDSRKLDTILADLDETMRAARVDDPNDCERRTDPNCDPCLTERLVVDGVAHEDDPCSESVCAGYAQRFQAAGHFIDGLAPPAM